MGLTWSVSRFTSARASPRKRVPVKSWFRGAVKDLMSQSGIRFKDRGVHRLKGVPKRWRLYRVEQ
jgi:hypothetical protein